MHEPYEGNSPPKDCALITTQVTGAIVPINKSKPAVDIFDVTDDIKPLNNFVNVRHARKETKVDIQSVSVANRKKINCVSNNNLIFTNSFLLLIFIISACILL